MGCIPCLVCVACVHSTCRLTLSLTFIWVLLTACDLVFTVSFSVSHGFGSLACFLLLLCFIVPVFSFCRCALLVFLVLLLLSLFSMFPPPVSHVPMSVSPPVTSCFILVFVLSLAFVVHVWFIPAVFPLVSLRYPVCVFKSSVSVHCRVLRISCGFLPCHVMSRIPSSRCLVLVCL